MSTDAERAAFEAWAIRRGYAHFDKDGFTFKPPWVLCELLAWDMWQSLTGSAAEAAWPALTFTAPEAENLLATFGGEAGSMTVRRLAAGEGPADDDGTAAPGGLYAHFTDYPEEGCMYLGPADEEAKPAPPLTDAQIDAILRAVPGKLTREWFDAYARAIERAHGIGAPPQAGD